MGVPEDQARFALLMHNCDPTRAVDVIFNDSQSLERYMAQEITKQ